MSKISAINKSYDLRSPINSPAMHNFIKVFKISMRKLL